MSLTAPALVKLAVRIVGAAAKTAPSPMPDAYCVAPELLVVALELGDPLPVRSNCGLEKLPPAKLRTYRYEWPPTVQTLEFG